MPFFVAVPVYNEYYHEYRAEYGRTTAKGIANTKYIISHLMNEYGWQFPAICGILGNLQAESALNPNRPEESGYKVDGVKYPSADWFPTNYAHGVQRGRYGFGLAQWTPWWKAYTSGFDESNGDGMGHPTFYYWCKNVYGTGDATASDSNPIGKMEPQLKYLTDVPWGYYVYERWKSQGYYYNYSWTGFKGITDPKEAAGAWLFNYERPGNVSDPEKTIDDMKRTLTARQNNAQWYYDTYYDEFGGGSPTPPTPPTPMPSGKLLKGGKNVWRILRLIQAFA